MPTDTEQQKVETKDRAPIVDTIQRLTFSVDGGLFKPDAIVGTKSWDIYDEMQRRDPRIARGLGFLKDFMDKHPRFFHFDQDDFGNLKPDGLVQFWQMANEIRHDTSKFVIYS